MKKHLFFVILSMTFLITSCEQESMNALLSKKIGIFSISETATIAFSSGNLQYHPESKKWRFAENQYDFVGEDNKNISSNYDGWIDLFGWGTGANPANSSVDYNDYQTFVDWGTNKIGDDDPNQWRTLSRDEWDYILYKRKNAELLKGIAQVAGINGLILLPDGWSCPADITFKNGFFTDANADYPSTQYNLHQSFTKEEWQKLEQSNAVFLPNAGIRRGDVYPNEVYYGCYWSKSENYTYDAWFIYIFDYAAFTDTDENRCVGRSVRLVKDLQ